MKGSELIFAIMIVSGKEEYSFSELLQLCSVFAINESQLRTNLSRMTGTGIVSSSREGKHAFYRFADRGASLKQNIALSFGSLDWSDWDKKWWGVSFSVPDLEKSERHYIRKKLSAYRFVSFNPGFWIRPLNRAEKLEEHLKNIFANRHCCAVQLDFYTGISRQEVARLWSLESINKDFLFGLEIVKESRARLLRLAPEESFKEKILCGNRIVSILFKDPLLPETFLPEDWTGERLKDEFSLWHEEVTERTKLFLQRLN